MPQLLASPGGLSPQLRLANWPKQMPEVRPEPDGEIERDQREHDRLEHAVLQVVWIARRGV